MDQVKTLEIDHGKMNSRGQIIIPKAIRDIFKDMFDITKSVPFEIRLMQSGIIELVPTASFPVSNYMDVDENMTRSAARAYLQGKNNEFVPESEIDKMLEE
jgi:bifunctional DNA-binding transcriptional regulator/antitoxin component of YhaV-PrlF toxin-antitoxin module